MERSLLFADFGSFLDEKLDDINFKDGLPSAPNNLKVIFVLRHLL